MALFSEDFSYDFYKRIIDTVKSIGSIVSMFEYDNTSDAEGIFFIWRHDVDVSLDYALAMAKLEAKLDISATYMIIPDSPLYKITDRRNQKIIRQIEDMGHEIALHFDIDSVGLKNYNNIQNINTAIYRDLNKINQISSKAVTSISFHRPIQQFLYGNKYICDCLNAYSSELMEFYISDSKGSWRAGNPLEIIFMKDFKVGQILTHPIWWSDIHIPPIQKLNHLLLEKSKILPVIEFNEYKKNINKNLPGVTQNSKLFK